MCYKTTSTSPEKNGQKGKKTKTNAVLFGTLNNSFWEIDKE